MTPRTRPGHGSRSACRPGDLAGLTRPNGIPSAVAVAAPGTKSNGREARFPQAGGGGAFLAPDWVAYVLWVGGQIDDLLRGYFRVQSVWNSRLDFAGGSLRFVESLLLHGGGVTFPMARDRCSGERRVVLPAVPGPCPTAVNGLGWRAASAGA